MWCLEGGGKQKKWCFGKLRASLYWRAFQKIEYFTAWIFFFTQRKKVSKMLFQLNLVIYICNRTAKKIHCFFSISFVCLFITLFYVPILLNMSIESFPALQECSRRLFWCFRKFRNLPDDCFGTFGISEMFPTAVLAFSEIPKRSRRSF